MDEDYKIWFQHEIFYIESLLSITRTIQSEVNAVEFILKELQSGEHKNENILIDAVQNICTQTALISKFFWPITKDKIHKVRGQKLREVYKITETSCLKSKEVRNFIEHFDEKLDLFLNNFQAGSIIPRYVGTRINKEGTKIFRGYFIEEVVFKIFDLEYELLPILNEIKILHHKLERDIVNGRFNNY